RRRRHRDRRHSATAFLVVIGVFAVVALVGWWGYGKIHEFFVAPDYDGSGSGSVSVKIDNGDSISTIGNTLVRAKVVKSTGAFVDAADADQRSRKLQPGTYNMRKKMSAKSALGRLLDPAARVTGRFTVREGLTVKATLALVHEHTNISLDDLEAAAKDPKALGVPDWGKGNLEGFLFPNTYEVDPSASATDALKQMVSQANAVFTQLNFAATAQQMGYDPYQVLTVASMVEMEGVADDFGKIARVAYNRLSANMPLQFDSTTQYWLELNGQGRKKGKLTDGDLRSEQNGYSTTTNRGLPPTAISNPGKSAIQAALSPPAGNWLYFAVTSEDGHSSFTNNLNQHNQNVQVCRQKKLGC
ncbi:MAG: endolytic transglycosylase MltG, partial [Mycobacteriales bacterium]